MKENFRLFVNHFVHFVSSIWAFLFFFIIISAWFLFGFNQGFTKYWHLILHNTLNIITFFIVLLIQHTKYRDTISMQLKLDELVKALEGARNDLINVQIQPDHYLEKYQQQAEESSKK